jgi:hypothetical protein
VLAQLKALEAGQTLPEADLQNLSKKRKLLDRMCVLRIVGARCAAAPLS